jgi:hypothetical protein
MRNMRTIGVDLEPFVKKGTLRLHSSRPTLHGLEMHLVQVHKMVSEFNPAAVVIDPISNFIDNSTAIEAQAMLLRLVDFLKSKQITALFTHLTSGSAALEATDIGISSLIDTWLLLRDIEVGTYPHQGPLRAQVARHASFARTSANSCSPPGASSSSRSPASPERSSERNDTLETAPPARNGTCGSTPPAKAPSRSPRSTT